jgi:hypothetical protein
MSRVVATGVALLSLGGLLVDLWIFDYFGPFIVIPIVLLPMGLLGALLIWRVPRNPVGWLVGLSGVACEGGFAASAYGWHALVRVPGVLPGGELAIAVSNAWFGPTIGCMVLTLLFFPTGHGLGGRWRWVERAMIVLVVLITVGTVFKDALIDVSPPLTVGVTSVRIANPLAIDGPLAGLVALFASLSEASTIPVILIGPLSLIVRYRRSSAIERHQIKWIAYSGSLAMSLIVLSNVLGGDLANWLWGAGALSLGLVPIAVALAIFRYRLYDIDVLIRRTLIYAAVSGVLAAAYIGGLALFQALLAPFTSGNGIAVAVSTLSVIALFQPVRRRIQSAVDRRFYRAKYSAEHTLDAFSSRLRDQVDLREVERDLVAIAHETMQPTHASLWLRKPTP